MGSASYASWRGGRRCRDVAMVDKIEVTVHVTINGMYFPRNLDCTDDLLQTVADFTHPSDLFPRCDARNICTTPQRRMDIQWSHVALYF